MSGKIVKADMTSTRMDYAQLFQQGSRFCELIFTPQKNANEVQTAGCRYGGGGEDPKSIHNGLLCKEVRSKETISDL